MHVIEGSSSTQRVRVAGHASRGKEHRQQMEEDGVVPMRRGARGNRTDVEPHVEHQSEQHEQEYDEMDVHQLEEETLEEELEAMEDDMEDTEPQKWQTRKKRVVDHEPLDDYPDGPHDTSLLWRYHVHLARKASEGEVFINVKLTLIFC